MILLNPKQHNREYADERSRQIMLKTIEFFENKGKRQLKKDDRERVWYEDLLEFIKENEIFATLLTPPAYGGEDCRWDTWRNCEFNEILAFYGLHYWYTWQVSILGLGPIWMSDNEQAKARAGELLKKGEVFAFGLSERDHGADIYSTEMSLTPQDDGTYLANGEKYYIGNGNVAEMVSTFGKMSDTGDYVFFVANYKNKNYELVKNVVNAQSYVADFKLNDYVVREEDILSRGQDAWDDALNTVNVGKYNLGWASVGICTHAFYEALNHAANRRLYGMYVTDFPHVKQMFVDAYTRLVAMKLFALRTADYMRAASPQDRRYLLYNPTVKMKVTTQGEEVINLLWDVIAAKGFERDTYFEMAARDIRAMPKLEGTVHVNIALIVKFMRNYFFNPQEYPDLARQDQPKHDEFLFNQGPASGLSKIRFHDYKAAYESRDVANVRLFREQIAIFKEMLMAATPDDKQSRDTDFLLALGEIFTLVVYGQLILENANIYELQDELVDQIFDFMVRDFAKFALQLYGKPATNQKQMDYLLQMIHKPKTDESRYHQVWQNHVYALKDVYEMNP
ncbi:acyl-CoA dehydrogenase [Dethiobacter alkaliphilus]|uniref:Acyl-CoA dehydrogenase domain protein n=1 Tax=Dethiobacter alkaliphilus AHT 1 TaxID=555088 RepID=C0GJ79_DETAL|nr:acyl-CoA dehydrogenase [Dethiobacter alkaliphilus]EEG76564.1 acyl-CoA dehydrogenase domain protein [Dethiobacter alkaliphilus AHT 1]